MTPAKIFEIITPLLLIIIFAVVLLVPVPRWVGQLLLIPMVLVALYWTVAAWRRSRQPGL